MKPRELRELDEARILDLDVRADLRAGREPFPRIMEARSALEPDQVLRLRAIFEPRPLYRVLADEGFRHWTERLADNDWRVWFYRFHEERRSPDDADIAPSGAHPAPAHATVPPDDDGASGPATITRDGCGCAESRLPTIPGCGTLDASHADIHTLDVRGLEPPEPMVRTLEALRALPWGHTLVQLNVRIPRFLLRELEERDFSWRIVEESPELVRVSIRHADPVPVLDARLLAPPVKHAIIIRTFEALERGSAFVLMNDHDPLPLRAQLQARHPDAFSWRYLEEGPELWRIHIRRTA